MKLKILLPLLAAAVIALFVFRGCNSTEVVIEDTEETLEVRQMMNDIVQQQMQSELGNDASPGAPPTTPPPGPGQQAPGGIAPQGGP